jgi:hypothetical protein
MAGDMRGAADYTQAVDLCMSVLATYDVCWESVFSAAARATPVEGACSPLPELMNPKIGNIIKRRWSMNPGARVLFGDILETLRQIGFE